MRKELAEHGKEKEKTRTLRKGGENEDD